ncbi:alpha-(1,3)-fucosyltransferase 10 isoform X2 [Planococcus citri]|uniref:alpha-(1,3)-fucosyltransferase 10 isoform X2 n=1 Tax=Planococcus citri TaxID=170843 RepID=UPI0031F8F123
MKIYRDIIQACPLYYGGLLTLALKMESENATIESVSSRMIELFGIKVALSFSYRTELIAEIVHYLFSPPLNEKSPRSLRNAFAFYGSDIDPEDLPLPKMDKFWALIHEESPKNTPILLSDDFLKLFDFTSTFSRTSHFPLTALHLNNLNDIRDLKYFVPVDEKNAYVKKGEIGSVLYIQSDCDTFTDRDAYVAELSKYISVDSYGRCLNNAKLPENLKNVSSFYSSDFLRFVARYKFTLAIENAVCDDYITEKLWRPLMVGSVPIYFGSPTVRDWLPNHESAILITDFNGPRDLSNYLHKLNSNDKLYELMLSHKLEGTISNQMLKNMIKSRRWKWHDDDNYGNYIDEFECQICLYLHGDKLLTKNTKRSHYSCSLPYSLLTGEKNKSNQWNDILRYEKCHGEALSSFVSSQSVNYADTDVRRKIDELISEEKC